MLTLLLAAPGLAEPWKKASEGDGYVSSSGTIMATAAPQSANRVVSVAKAFAGLPYVWAGTRPTEGFDCSGYVYEVMRLNGYEVPRMADEQFVDTERVKYEDLKPGDLVFFTTYLPGPSHVGFYLGEGDFIHASSAAEGVVVSSMTSGYYRERFLGGGRPDGWLGKPVVAQAAEQVVDLNEPIVAAVEEELDLPAADATPAAELDKSPVDEFNPFARHRAPQPVRVSVVPEVETSSEAALEEWKLVLGETVALGRLHLQSLVESLTWSLSS